MSGGTASWTVCECVCVARTQIPHFYCIFSFPDITQAIPARCHGHSTKTYLKIFKPLLLSATFLLSKKCRRNKQGPSIHSISPSPVHQTKRRGNKRHRSPIRSSSLHWMTTGKLRPWQGQWGKKISTTVSLTIPASKHLVGEKLMEKNSISAADFSGRMKLWPGHLQGKGNSGRGVFYLQLRTWYAANIFCKSVKTDWTSSSVRRTWELTPPTEIPPYLWNKRPNSASAEGNALKSKSPLSPSVSFKCFAWQDEGMFFKGDFDKRWEFFYSSSKEHMSF